MTRILAVDDSATIRRCLEITFVGTEFDLHLCSTSAEALTAVGEQVPSLILLDVGLGATDGYDVLTQLGEAAPGVPVVMMVSKQKQLDEARAASAAGHIAKPFDTQKLQDKVRDVMESWSTEALGDDDLLFEAPIEVEPEPVPAPPAPPPAPAAVMPPAPVTEPPTDSVSVPQPVSSPLAELAPPAVVPPPHAPKATALGLGAVGSEPHQRETLERLPDFAEPIEASSSSEPFSFGNDDPTQSSPLELDEPGSTPAPSVVLDEPGSVPKSGWSESVAPPPVIDQTPGPLSVDDPAAALDDLDQPSYSAMSVPPEIQVPPEIEQMPSSEQPLVDPLSSLPPPPEPEDQTFAPSDTPADFFQAETRGPASSDMVPDSKPVINGMAEGLSEWPEPNAELTISSPVPRPAPTGVSDLRELSTKLESMGLTPEQLDGVLALSREVIERVVWEVVPALAEQIIKQELSRLTED